MNNVVFVIDKEDEQWYINLADQNQEIWNIRHFQY